MRPMMPLVPALALIASACSVCEPLASVPIEGRLEAGIARHLDAFAAIATADHMCLRAVVTEPAATFEARVGDDAAAQYLPDRRTIVLNESQVDEEVWLQTLVWHELCHAWDAQTGHPSRGAQWAGVDPGPSYASRDLSNRMQGKESFAVLCEMGPEGLHRVRAWSEACGDQDTARRVTSLLETVYGDAAPVPPGPLVEVRGIAEAPSGTSFVEGWSQVLPHDDTLIVGVQREGATNFQTVAIGLRRAARPVLGVAGEVSSLPVPGWVPTDGRRTAGGDRVETWAAQVPGAGVAGVVTSTSDTGAPIAMRGVCGGGVLRIVGDDALWAVSYEDTLLRWWALER